MGFDEISSKYAELDQAGREDMLLEMFAKRNYNACIETQIADEGPAFIARIIRPMYSAYRYLAMRLLATLAERQGLNAFCQVLMDSHFSELIPRADLSLVDKYITTDNNPMHEPYQRLGPQLFVALWDCHFASTHDIYLWTRSSPQRCHEDVLLALVRDHANDPTGHCGEIIRDAFLTERAIAMAKKQHWLLWDQIPLCAALIDAVGPCIHHLLSALLQI